MSKIKLDKISSGILQPALQYRWRLVVTSSGTYLPLIGLQVINSTVSYLSHELHLEIHQPITSELHEEITALIKQPSNIFRIDVLDSDGEVVHSIEFTNVAVLRHSVEFNYANADIVCHTLACLFDQYSILPPNISDIQISSEERYIHAMKLLK